MGIHRVNQDRLDTRMALLFHLKTGRHDRNGKAERFSGTCPGGDNGILSGKYRAYRITLVAIEVDRWNRSVARVLCKILRYSGVKNTLLNQGVKRSSISISVGELNIWALEKE